MSICNFRCQYCYLTHRSEYYQNKQPNYQYSPEHVAKALSKERLGGVAYVNLCADGETLLAKDITKYTHELLKEGHYIEFVTNLSVTKILDEILSWDTELLNRLEFKCSFHYLQLKEKNLLDTFSNNVKKIWAAGASANIETTPHDELIPYIDELKKFALKNFGALPHLTIARNDDTDNIEYLTNLPMAEYDEIWSTFGSTFWEFKKTFFTKKQEQFCYAGEWSLYVNLATGNANQCYVSRITQNIFEDLSKPINFKPIGRCLLPHCYNGHSLLSLGCIPQFDQARYGDIRNRIKLDESQWLQPKLKNFFNTRLEESNTRLDPKTENDIIRKFKRQEQLAALNPVNLAKRIVGKKGVDCIKKIIRHKNA